MKILDLGGLRKQKESEDIVTVNIGGLGDVEYDLNKFPYPFKDNMFDEVRIYHTLEHLERPIKVMEEVWRILKPEGIVKIKVPYWKLFSTFSNPFHLHEFKEEWFYNLSPDAPIYKGEVENMNPFIPKLNFKVIKMERHKTPFGFDNWNKVSGLKRFIPNNVFKVLELEVWLKK